jgi:hypothetical protein
MPRSAMPCFAWQSGRQQTLCALQTSRASCSLHAPCGGVSSNWAVVVLLLQLQLPLFRCGNAVRLLVFCTRGPVAAMVCGGWCAA